MCFNSSYEREMIKVAVINSWTGGYNPLGVTLSSANDETTTLFCNYIKSYRVSDVKPTLDSLLSSKYLQQRLKNEKEELKIDCIPEISFKKISFPYLDEYNNIVNQFNLHEFIDSDDKVAIEILKRDHNVKEDIFLSIILFGSICIVNLLPPIDTDIDETEEDDY